MKKEIVKFLILLMVAVGGGPAGAAIWSWSTTASTNATADSSINWAEGMAPSAVNDSARAMMAVLAAWRNDISASNTSAGSSTAYTLATSEGVNTTPATGQMLAFIAHATNGVSPTLRVDGGNTYAIQSAAGTAIAAGTLVAGTPYRTAFNGTAWVMEGSYGTPYGIPLGGFMASSLSTPPNSNFILPAGQCISTTTYNAYWVALGSPASGACPGGQFAVMDLRGRTLSALDNLNGTPAGLMTNSAAGCGVAFTSIGAVCGNQSQTLTLQHLPTGITSTGTVFVTVAGSGGLVYLVGGQSLANLVVNNGANTTIEVGLGANSLGTASATGTTNVTSNNTNGNPHPIVMPTIAVSYFLRVF